MVLPLAYMVRSMVPALVLPLIHAIW
jgi:hypothetical protein